jgi:hypothetical protein
MKRHAVLMSATLAAMVGFSSLAHAHVNLSNPSEWDQDYFYLGFGGPAPAGAVEYSVGFSTIGDFDGRILSNCSVTTSVGPLTTIGTNLFTGTDANLYEIAITNPSTFSASITSTGLVMALFNSSGNGLAASVGGAGDAITGANAGLTAPGIYFLGIANPGMYPQNNEGQNIFGLSSAAGIYTPVTSDTVLSTNAGTAWTLGSAYPGLLQNVSFFASGSTITLAGAGYAVVPEPASISMLVVGGAALLARRRKA